MLTQCECPHTDRRRHLPATFGIGLYRITDSRLGRINYGPLSQWLLPIETFRRNSNGLLIYLTGTYLMLCWFGSIFFLLHIFHLLWMFGRNRVAPELPAPPGYLPSVASAAAEATRESDSSLLIKRSWDVALQPLKQVVQVLDDRGVKCFGYN